MMEEPKDKVKSKRRIIASVIISVALISFTISAVLLSTWFLSTDAPEVVDTEETESVIPYPTQKDEGKSGLAELDYGEEQVEEIVEPVYENSFEPRVELEETVINKVKEIPLTVLDMAKFVSTNPTLSDKDVDLLISYVVGKERGYVDTERDLEVEKLMEKYLE